MNALAARAVALAASSAAATGAKRVAELGWERFTGESPPTAEEVHDDRGLRDLLVWVAVVTVAVGLARMVARRGAERLT